MTALAILYLLMAASSVLGEFKIHHHMTAREIRETFNTDPEEVPDEYEVVPVEIVEPETRAKRQASGSGPRTMTVEAFGEKHELYLEPSDHVLYGSSTPMYYAWGKKDANGGYTVTYQKKALPPLRNMQLFQDRKKRAAIAIHEDAEGNVYVNGVIGDDIAIRSLPPRVRRAANQHVVVKLPQGNIQVDPDKVIQDLKDGKSYSWNTANGAITQGDVLENLRQQGLLKGKDDPNIVIVHFPQGKIAVNVPDFFGKIEKGTLPIYRVGNGQKEAVDVVEQLYKEGYAKNYQKLYVPLRFSGGGSIIVDVEKIKKNLADNLNYRYGLSNGEMKSDKEIVEALRQKGVNLPKPSGDTVYPQLLITMDFDTAKSFNNNPEIITKYMLSFWNAVDLRYRELSNPKVRLNIAGIIIPQNVEAVAYLNHGYSKDDLIKTTGSQFVKDGKSVPFDSYDIVTAFLNVKVLPFTTNTVGYATTAAGCANKNGQSVELIADVGSFGSVNVAAHELGHNLGVVNHDDDCPNAPTGYIMAASSNDGSNTIRAIRWSQCSKGQFTKYLRDYGAACLYNKPNVGKPGQKVLPGRFLSRDQQCKRRGGSKYSASKDSVSNCLKLECTYVESNGSSRTTFRRAVGVPAEGTSCGSKKICLDGQCVDDA